jgi:uncharacterized protein (DUF924 family)
MSAQGYRRVLDFWFGRKGSRDYLKEKSFWYGSPADDAHLRGIFSGDYKAAKDGQYDDWIQTGNGEGALALIILLDQVPRNIFRGAPKAYATDDKAVSMARYAVEWGWDKGLHPIQRRYMYSPFNHSEKLADQEMSLKLFTELGDNKHLYWAQSSYDQIKQYGRFVHRDQILGR